MTSQNNNGGATMCFAAMIAMAACLLPTASSTASTNSRPPMSLSSIINDLEAEGVSRGISAATILTSKTVSPASRSTLLKSIISHGLSEEDQASALEDVEEDVTSVGKLRDGVGMAFASASSASEAASTVQACGKSVVYVPSELDLYRGEGLFDTLAPAVETVLNQESGSEEGEGKSTLVVFLPCSRGDETKLERLRSQFESAASTMVAGLAVSGDKTPSSLEDVFDNVKYLAEDDMEPSSVGSLLDAICPEGGEGLSLREPSDALAAVAAAVPFTLDSLFMVTDDAKVRELTAMDIAMARKLHPVKRAALQNAIALVTDQTTEGDKTQLVTNFGELCQAAIDSATSTFDESISGQSSPLAKSLRNDLIEDLASSLEDLYDLQIAELKMAMFEQCQKKLSGLRVSPNLAGDMNDIMKETQKDFDTAVGKLVPKGGGVSTAASSSWTSLASAAKVDFRKSIKEYCTDRLQAARASGAFRPVPRKGVTLGLHWLLPQPFGADYRQAEKRRKIDRSFVYHPEVSEVSPDDVRKGTGEWKSKIVPNPSGTDILYQGPEVEDMDDYAIE